MKTTIVDITPAMAELLLANNPNIRSMREHRVDAAVRAIKAGKFKLTHQGIAIREDGALLDGQHRLMAIVRAGVPVRMMVTTGVPQDVGDAIDSGLPRAVFERLGTDKLTTSIVTCLLGVVAAIRSPQEFEVELCIEIFAPYLDECERSINSWRAKNRTGSAAALAAMVLLVASMKDSPEAEEMKANMARALSGELYGAPRAVVNYWKQMNEGVKVIGAATKGGSGQAERFCRAWIAMQPKNRDLKLLLIRDREKIIGEARAAFHAVTQNVFSNSRDGGSR